MGGNASATEFFTRRGGASLLGKDSRAKYVSPVADLYKEELAKRVKEDNAAYVTPDTALNILSQLPGFLMAWPWKALRPQGHPTQNLRLKRISLRLGTNPPLRGQALLHRRSHRLLPFQDPPLP